MTEFKEDWVTKVLELSPVCHPTEFHLLTKTVRNFGISLKFLQIKDTQSLLAAANTEVKDTAEFLDLMLTPYKI